MLDPANLIFAQIKTDSPYAYQALIADEYTRSAILCEWQEEGWKPISGFRDMELNGDISFVKCYNKPVPLDGMRLPDEFIDKLEALYEL